MHYACINDCGPICGKTPEEKRQSSTQEPPRARACSRVNTQTHYFNCARGRVFFWGGFWKGGNVVVSGEEECEALEHSEVVLMLCTLSACDRADVHYMLV